MNPAKREDARQGMPESGETTVGIENRPADSSDLPGAVKIKIDRNDRIVPPDLLKGGRLTGSEIRRVGEVGQNRDLFEVVPGGSDRKIENNEAVQTRDGMRFFTAPQRINPG